VADVQSNIQVNIDTSPALASLKNLQRQLAIFNTSFSKSSTAATKAQADFAANLVNSVNATGKFSAGIQNIQSATERFTQSLEKNKFSTREYFKYAAGSTKTFSKMFSTEFNTIQKVAEERVKDLQTQYIKMGRNANGALQAIAVRPLSLDMEDLATKVALTSQKQQIFGQLLKQGSTNLLNFGKNTQWAGRQLMVGFTIPLTIFGSKASQVFMELEQQALKFKRVYGEMFTTQAETQKALDDVRKLAEEFTKYGVAVADTMEMAANAAAQGKQGADLMAQVTEATRLAVLGQVEQQQALDTTISLQNAFGYSAEELASKIDFLNAVENQTVVGIEDLTIAIPKAGPVVKQLGGNVEDLAFFLTAMKEGGINASEGANALKSGLASLINPSEKAAAMLQDLGINIEAIVEGNKGDIKGTVIGFAQALDTLAPLERARAIEQLFGKFQFARLSTLFQNVTKDGSQAARTLDLTGKSVEELAILSERELGAVENATGVKFKKAIENLKVSIAPVGEQFLKAVTPIAEFVAKILDKFNGLSDGVKSGISRILLIVGGIGPVVLMTFGLLANGLANIIKLFAAVRNGFLGLGKNSNQLAFQTQYMSTEQQEAATVAASLDQAHSKLIQTFTVEKSAVAQLATAYQQAAIAGARLQQTNPGFFRPGAKPPGFAKGIVSVPGPKGAGDVVPAMLSPGEAVIPTEQNKKYAPLIAGIIADNIPGFAGGTTGFWTGGRRKSLIDDLGLNPDERVRIPLGRESRAYSVAGVMAPKEINASPLGMTKEFLQSSAGRAGMEANIQVELEAVGLSAQRVKEVLDKVSGIITVAIDQWDGSIEGWVRSANNAKTEVDGLVELTRQEKDAIRKRLAPTKASEYPVASTPIVEVSAEKAKPRDERNTTAYQRLRQIQILKDKGINATDWQFSHMPGFESIKTPNASSAQPTVRGRSLNEQQLERISKEVAEKAKLEASKVGENLVRGTIDGANKEGEMRSPSRKTYRQGQNLVRGMSDGINDETDKQTRRRRRITKSGAADGLQPAEKADIRYARRKGLGIEYVNERPVATNVAADANDKEKQLRDAEQQRRRTMLARTNGLMFAMSSLSSVMGMMGNGIAQKAAPFLVGINMATMAMQMIQGPWSALAVAVVALAAGVYLANEKAKQQAAATSKLVDATSATTEKMKEIGKITGKVGASELYAKKREGGVSNKFTTGFDRAGQQFGTTFLESDVGKNIFSSFQSSLATNGQVAIKQLGVQLSSYVADGLMDTQQAQSIARAIGISMSDMTITAKINGQLREVLGPNGQDILTNPLEVRLKIVEDQKGNVEEMQSRFTQMFEGAQGFFGSRNKAFIDSIKTLFGERPEEKLASTAAAMGAQTLESLQAQIDGVNKTYDTQIATLEKQKQTTKDKKEQLAIESEINRLTEQRTKDQKTLRDQTKNVLDMQFKTYKTILKSDPNDSTGAVDAFFNGLKTQVKEKYKNDPFADLFLGKTANLQSKELEVKLNTVVASGQMSPATALKMMDAFTGKEKQMEKSFNALITAQDPGRVSELFNILGNFSGKGSKKTVLDIVTKMSAQGQEKNFNKRLEVLNNLMLMDGKEVNMSAYLKVDGVEKLDELARLMDKVENIPDPLTKKALLDIQTTEGIDMSGIINEWDFYSNLPDDVKKTATQTYISIYKTIGTKEISDFATNQMASGAMTARQAERLNASKVAQGLNKELYKSQNFNTTKGGGDKKSKNKGERNTMFDDMLKKLKLFQNASVNALGGFKELERVMNAPKKKGGAYMTFDGITNQLIELSNIGKGYSKNISTDFIDMVEGLSPEELQKKFSKFIKISKDGVVTLKQDVVDLNRAMAAAAAGEIVAGNAKEMKKIQDRTAAVNILRAKGVDYATAMAVTESNSIALAIKNGDLTKEQIDELVTSQEKRNALELKYQQITSIKQQDAVTAQQMANDKMLAYLELQKAIIENSFIVQQTEIDVAQKRNGYALELISYEETIVNDVYDKQVKRLDEIISRNEEINRLQQSRLGLAQALSRGDMAGAAQAIQSIRQQEALAQIEAKKKALEKAREAQLGKITADGKTRAEIEKQNAENAKLQAEINLKILKQQIELSANFTKALNVTPEQAASYNTIAGLVQKIGGFNLDDAGVLKAIQDAANGKPEALLAGVKTQIDKMIQDLFGGTAAQKSLPGGQGNMVQGPGIPKEPPPTTQTTTPTPFSTSTSTPSSSYTIVGGTIIPINNTGKTTKKVADQAKAQEKTRKDFLRSIGIPGFMSGGIVPKYFANGGMSRGTDTVPAMLTPGEYVVRKSAVDSFGVDTMNSINNGQLPATSNSVYNYGISVNVSNSNANPNDIARTVINQIKQIDAQRIRSYR